jgi:hypothetical protein
MTNTIPAEPMSTAARNKMALTYGLILGLVYMVITTGVNMSVNGMIIYFGLKTLAYVLYMVILGLFAGRIRKANGGYIELREVFGAVFIMLFVAGAIIFIYNYIYMYYIDADFLNKIKASTLAFLEKSNAPDDKLDESMANFDKQIAEAKAVNIGKSLLNFLEGLVLDCLFGLVVSLIIKKPRPMFDTLA